MNRTGYEIASGDQCGSGTIFEKLNLKLVLSFLDLCKRRRMQKVQMISVNFHGESTLVWRKGQRSDFIIEFELCHLAEGREIPQGHSIARTGGEGLAIRRKAQCGNPFGLIRQSSQIFLRGDVPQYYGPITAACSEDPIVPGKRGT